MPNAAAHLASGHNEPAGLSLAKQRARLHLSPVSWPAVGAGVGVGGLSGRLLGTSGTLGSSGGSQQPPVAIVRLWRRRRRRRRWRRESQAKVGSAKEPPRRSPGLNLAAIPMAALLDPTRALAPASWLVGPPSGAPIAAKAGPSWRARGPICGRPTDWPAQLAGWLAVCFSRRSVAFASRAKPS